MASPTTNAKPKRQNNKVLAEKSTSAHLTKVNEPPQIMPASVSSSTAIVYLSNLIKSFGPDLGFFYPVDLEQLMFGFFDHAAITAKIKSGGRLQIASIF